MPANVDIAFTLNGVKRELTVPAGMSALAMLRDRLGLTGTKYQTVHTRGRAPGGPLAGTSSAAMTSGANWLG